VTIRVARPEDAVSVLEIYGPIIRDTSTSFEVQVPSVDEMSARIRKTLETHPWLVAEDSLGVLGYAYASIHRSREAYQWSCEVSVYVHPRAHRRGVAARLYETLFGLLIRQGYYRAFAGITLPNPPSVAFHESAGFTPIGVFRDIGFKHGKWHDVGWWQRELMPLTEPGAPPIPFVKLGTEVLRP
jgi:phosphinothricin acetyltransferase